MNASIKNTEPKWLTNWRIAYKKKYGGENFLENYKKNNKPFDFRSFKKYVMEKVKKGDIPKDIVAQMLDWAKKKDETIDEVPVYESPGEYTFLKDWANKIEAGIPGMITVEKDGQKEDFVLENSPYIITGQLGDLNAASGKIGNSGEYYIAFDSKFFYFINRISEVGSKLFLFELKNKKNNIKELMEINLGNDPDIYKYFRDAFYHFMFYGNKIFKKKDNNIRNMFVEEIFAKLTGFLPPPELNFCHFIDIGYVINESIGLFIMGHEYSHIIFHDMCNSSIEYNSEIAKFYQQEFQADEYALRLMWNCIQHEYNQFPKKVEKERARFCFWGVEIFFHCLHIIDRMRGVLEGNSGAVVNMDHPPTNRRKESLRNSIYRLWEKWEIPVQDAEFLDAVDFIFKKLGDRVIDELLKNEHVIAYREEKKAKIEKQIKEAVELFKMRDEYNNNNSSEPAIDAKIMELCRSILSEDPNNIMILYMLGSIYLMNYQDTEALDCFLSVINITGYEMDEGYPVDSNRFWASNYHVGYIYTQEVVNIIKNNHGKITDEQDKKINEILDDAIAFFTLALPYYHHNGMAFYYLGVIYSYRNDHNIAIEYFEKALQYQPDNPTVQFSYQHSHSKLMGLP